MLSGTAPFDDDSQPRLFENIAAGIYSFDDRSWDKVSDSAKALIRRMLVVDVKKRITLEQIEQSEWLSKSPASGTAETSTAANAKKGSRRATKK